ncbi:MAG: hypothetical protein K6G56_02015 [Clostridiales bacterium]|nr:hypothetical protein [Clostridiales bacterium]
MYRVADIVFEARDCGKYFEERAEKYRVFSGEPEFVIEAGADKIESAARQTGYAEESLRYMLSGLKFSVETVKRNGCVLHASAVAIDGKAYLFCAGSGVGKSTHAENWLKLLEGAYILNDDKPAIRIVGGKALAYGTPWSGKYDLSRNESAELAGIAFIERANDNSIARVSPEEAAKLILGASARRFSEERVRELLDTVCALAETIPVYRLLCTPDISSARVSSGVMIKE